MATRTPTTERAAGLERRFAGLAERWWLEAGGRSISTQMMDSDAFREIVALGEQIVPLILREMEHSHMHWHLALREITGEHPESAVQPGKIDQVCGAWLDWGRQRYPRQEDALTSALPGQLVRGPQSG